MQSSSNYLRIFELPSWAFVSGVISAPTLMSNQQRSPISILFCGPVGCQQYRCDCRLVRNLKIVFSVERPCVACCESVARSRFGASSARVRLCHVDIVLCCHKTMSFRMLFMCYILHTCLHHQFAMLRIHSEQVATDRHAVIIWQQSMAIVDSMGPI